MEHFVLLYFKLLFLFIISGAFYLLYFYFSYFIFLVEHFVLLYFKLLFLFIILCF